MKRAVRLQVVMAGKYRIPAGKKVTFRFNERTSLYLAESDGKVFGLAQYLVKGKPSQLKMLGRKFSGCVVESRPEERKLVVKVPMKRAVAR